MYLPVCDVCGDIIISGAIEVEKLHTAGYKNKQTLHFCNYICMGAFLRLKLSQEVEE